jgi:hypothetical protein
MAKRKSKPLIRPNSVCFQEPSWCDGKRPPFLALILKTKVIPTKLFQNRANSMHFIHAILNHLERGSNVRILPNTYRGNQTRFIERMSVEIHFYDYRKSKPLIRPKSKCFYVPSRCVGKIASFSALILQTKVLRTKWYENLAKPLHITQPILNRLERGSNVRILPNTYRCNQTRFIERISVEQHFHGWTKVKASNST